MRKHLLPRGPVCALVVTALAVGVGCAEPGDPASEIGTQSSALGRSVKRVATEWKHDGALTDITYQEFTYFPAVDRVCKTIAGPFDVWGALEGAAHMWSDVQCWTPDFSEGHVESALSYDTVLVKTGEKVTMSGRMVLDLDATVDPIAITGYMKFRNGEGTHHGQLFVKGAVGKNPDGTSFGAGTANGWIAKNR